MKKKDFTTAQGAPVSNDNQSMSTGIPGQTLIQDVQLLDKLAHFDRERIPERVVHAKGGGALGTFTVTHDVTEFTAAKFLSKVGKKTDVIARFSTVGGERGSADTERDPREFAIKFYTEDGNYDLVGNNTPIFFIRNAIKFPDFIHTQKRLAKNNLKDANMVWDFFSLNPESLHQAAFLFSNRGTPYGFRHMHGFGSHTFMWYTDNKNYVWVKYHWICDQPIKNFTGPEADAIRGIDPDMAVRDLSEAIEEKNYPSWTLKVQIITPEEAKTYKFDPFDVTKVWYHGNFPLRPVGKMVLNQNPTNFFAEVEQVAFAPSHFVYGVDASPDKLLQGRLFSYPDTQRHRLGTNFEQLPVNAPKHGNVNNYQRDGFMTYGDNGGDGANYFPNSTDGLATPNDSYGPPSLPINGRGEKHLLEIADIDFEQPGEFYRRVLMGKEKEDFLMNIAGHLGQAEEKIQYRQTALFYKADRDWGEKITKALNLDLKKVIKLSEMTQDERVAKTLK